MARGERVVVSVSRVLFSNFLFLYSFASLEIRSEKEVWAFSNISFVADLGGSISLFLGVSIFSFWDFFEYVFKGFKECLRDFK